MSEAMRRAFGLTMVTEEMLAEALSRAAAEAERQYVSSRGGEDWSSTSPRFASLVYEALVRLERKTK